MPLLGIDIGTQSVKAALFSEDGKVLASATRASRHYKPAPGIVEEDPEFQLLSVCETIRECLANSGVKSSDIAGLGIDGQMAGVIGIGQDGKAITPYDSWLDTRCAPYITRMQEAAGADILRTTGNPPSLNHGPKKLWWKHERPEIFEKIAKFVQPGGYVAMRLCGLAADDAFIDSTYLHFSGFADNVKLCWDESLCEQFGVPSGKLPRIVEPHAVIGNVTAEMSAACGLASGTPMIAGCGDSAASFLSCGATREGICVDIAGTASVFAATVGGFCTDPEHVLGCGRSATPGLWHPYAYINGGGQNLEWFREQFASQHTLDELNALAAAVERRQDLPMFIPHLGGRVSPGWPSLRGSWAGLQWDHGAPELYLAAIEAVALEYAIYQQTLSNLLPDFDSTEIRVTGGGEKSTLWNQIKANVLQTRITGIAGGEGAPMGVALLAGFGLGIFDSLPTSADRWIELADSVIPDKNSKNYYDERKARYCDLLEALHDWA
ncbi:MAG: FGGY family carbohydrate kinase [Verrucomicrobia bacterium]|nr:FGGY family carbohydrate kinase [Verrucomicrobiota bacterium]